MRNHRGFVETVLLYYVIAGIILFFVPNPLSSALGIGIRPNKTVEKVELIKDKQGVPIAYKTTESEIQQHVTFFEWLRSLPILGVLLMGLGVVFPPLAMYLHNLKVNLMAHAKKIVDGVDAGLKTLQDPVVKQKFLDEMTAVQGRNSPTEALVTDLQQKK